MTSVRPPRGRRGALLALILGLSSAVLAPAAAPADRPTSGDRPVVVTGGGPVRGLTHDGYTTYENIPFAAPPTGRLRWRPPQPARPWHGVRDAGAPGPQCPQPPLFGGAPTGSEDCLSLNVTVPAGPRPARGRPVMVWLHGGGFTYGSGGPHTAQHLAVRGGVVVVTVNYRLGMLGFFGHPELAEESVPFGLADQQAALRWVRDNAARFGADPGNVTLFGASAGGISTCAQLVAPAAAGLFHRAIAQSGTCTTAYPYGALVPDQPGYRPFIAQPALHAAGVAAAHRLGCRTGTGVLDCLRGLDADRLATPELSTLFNRPAYGNRLLPAEPARALDAGRFHRVPVIQGTTRDEMRMFLAFTLTAHPLRDARDYRSRLRNSFGDRAAAVEARYPLAAHPTPALAWAAVTTDSAWTCTTLRATRALARHVPVHAYEFADRGAPALEFLPDVPGFPYGAAHGFEVPYLGLMAARQPLTGAQRALADELTGYWTRFAHTGDPDGAGAPHWPAYGSRSPLAQTLAPAPGGIHPVALEADHHCAFWDEELAPPGHE
ncbi:carboxylesterase/lipase family protein [Streptomyces sp. NBC_00239]|uniref:carboxylesterase/lipase family protein n=1 Tax=Streptomyces sp. NBC_00239 TaxID=2903640 RepID=UPI002E2938CE|nr:carboxylesterase family protein [Streptomyces sp. NBC_00239]